MAETTPDRLIAALTAAGWVEEGHYSPAIKRLWWTSEEPPRLLVVPLDIESPDYEATMGAVLAELGRAVAYGDAADRALTEATCSCGGRRWVDDENWQPQLWEMQRGREPESGLIPCGGCNEGGWDVPVGPMESSDLSGRMPT